MVTRQKQQQIHAVFLVAMQSALDELTEKDILDTWWPESFCPRLAEMATQAVAMMAESSEMAEEVMSPRVI